MVQSLKPLHIISMFLLILYRFQLLCTSKTRLFSSIEDKIFLTVTVLKSFPGSCLVLNLENFEYLNIKWKNYSF